MTVSGASVAQHRPRSRAAGLLFASRREPLDNRQGRFRVISRLLDNSSMDTAQPGSTVDAARRVSGAWSPGALCFLGVRFPREASAALGTIRSRLPGVLSGLSSPASQEIAL